MKHFYHVILIYIMISFYEWFLHKHIMHGDPEFLGKFPFIGEYLKKTAVSHHDHHKLINIDMTMKENKPDDRSAYFPWSLSIGLAISFFVLIRPVIPRPLFCLLYTSPSPRD